VGRGCTVGHRIVGETYVVVVVGVVVVIVVVVVVVVVLHGAVSPDMQLRRQGSRENPSVSDFIFTSFFTSSLTSSRMKARSLSERQLGK